MQPPEGQARKEVGSTDFQEALPSQGKLIIVKLMFHSLHFKEQTKYMIVDAIETNPCDTNSLKKKLTITELRYHRVLKKHILITISELQWLKLLLHNQKNSAKMCEVHTVRPWPDVTQLSIAHMSCALSRKSASPHGHQYHCTLTQVIFAGKLLAKLINLL